MKIIGIRKKKKKPRAIHPRNYLILKFKFMKIFFYDFKRFAGRRFSIYKVLCNNFSKNFTLFDVISEKIFGPDLPNKILI